ncbi:MAG: DUF4124 domain-containing protein [Burkholderiales bacterium]
MRRPALFPDALTHSPALVLGLVMFALAMPAAAQWKWRGADGKIQYSDRPPPADLPEKNILSRPPGFNKPPVVVVTQMDAAASAPASAAVAPSRKPTEAAIDAKRREAQAAAEAQRTAEAAKAAKQQADNCQRARDYARSLDSGVRIARVNAQGERVVLEDDDRAKEAKRTQEVIASDCR